MPDIIVRVGHMLFHKRCSTKRFYGCALGVEEKSEGIPAGKTCVECEELLIK